MLYVCLFINAECEMRHGDYDARAVYDGGTCAGHPVVVFSKRRQSLPNLYHQYSPVYVHIYFLR